VGSKCAVAGAFVVMDAFVFVCVFFFLFFVVVCGCGKEALVVEAWYLIARTAFRGASTPRLLMCRLALSVVLCQFTSPTRHWIVITSTVVETRRGQLVSCSKVCAAITTPGASTPAARIPAAGRGIT